MTVLKSFQTFSLSVFGPWILGLVWLLVQALTFWHFGVVEAVDSDFYLNNAQLLSQGHLPTDRGIWYLSYSLFLAFVLEWGGNLTLIVGIQYLFSGIAAWALYTAVYRLFKDDTTAFVAVLQYVLWIKIHQWNSYIYTESLFISFSIISFALLSWSHKKTHYFLTAFVMAFALLLRPTGICLFMALGGYFLFIAYRQKHFSVFYFFSTMAGLSLLLVVLLNKMMEEYIYYFIDSYRKAELIYPNVNLGLLAVPPQLHIPSASHAPLVQLMEFMLYNPLYFLQLAGMKCILFLGNVKPYFSWAHNIALVTVLYPIYALAVYGFKTMEWKAEKMFMICFILMQTLTVSLTSENWDGRFLILILPFVFIYSAWGVNRLKRKYQNQTNHSTPQK